jgi:hypothetical protein
MAVIMDSLFMKMIERFLLIDYPVTMGLQVGFGFIHPNVLIETAGFFPIFCDQPLIFAIYIEMGADPVNCIWDL